MSRSPTRCLPNFENLMLLDAGGAIDGTGNALDNVITGNASANMLVGGGRQRYAER